LTSGEFATFQPDADGLPARVEDVSGREFGSLQCPTMQFGAPRTRTTGEDRRRCTHVLEATIPSLWSWPQRPDSGRARSDQSIRRRHHGRSRTIFTPSGRRPQRPPIAAALPRQAGAGQRPDPSRRSGPEGRSSCVFPHPASACFAGSIWATNGYDASTRKARTFILQGLRQRTEICPGADAALALDDAGLRRKVQRLRDRLAQSEEERRVG